MSDSFIVRSRFGDYQVLFTEEFPGTVEHPIGQDSILAIDKRVWHLFQERFGSSAHKEQMVLVEAEEQNKTVDYCQKIGEQLLAKNIRRSNTLIAVGGGITQDVIGFISSILFRGINWTLWPTTLLAQADSCIGSKTSINFGNYKNLLGTFYPPAQVLVNVAFLETLSTEDVKSGIGEMMHYYLIAGDTKAEQLMAEYEETLSLPTRLREYILASLRIKKNVVEKDELDKGERNLFNYGHTFGHAVEAVSEYKVNHGQAVTMGMDIANYISLKLGHMDTGTFSSMRALLQKNMPDFCLPTAKLEEFIAALSKDKKNVGTDLGCILANGPGSMWKAQIPLDTKLRGLVAEYFQQSRGAL